jgi:hypothetical protein
LDRPDARLLAISQDIDAQRLPSEHPDRPCLGELAGRRHCLSKTELDKRGVKSPCILWRCLDEDIESSVKRGSA